MRNIRKKQILVVENNLINREFLKDILSEKYQVLEAENGQQGLECLELHTGSVDLILLDVMMPVMDGYTFLDTVKANPQYASIPVIVMTQEGGEKEEAKALSRGASDFLPKPYRPEIILHIIENMIFLREAAALANEYRYDRLTGLYTKGYFCQQVKEILAQNPDKMYDIVCFNIENFKLYNDVFGIKSGDRLLCEIADYFRERFAKLRENEIFSRYNADRFMWLRERTCDITEEICHEMYQQINRLSSARNLGIKLGIYQITDPSIPVEQMCDRAVLAVESIKGQYFKNISVYDGKLREKLMHEQAIVDEMEMALEHEQFEVYFQPKFSLLDGGLAGAEALVRWNHPQRGLISPADFIPLFEKNGFIARMDQHIWEKTCSTLKKWREKQYPRISVSVNVSRADFYYNDLAEILSDMVNRYEISPKELHLEITESAYMENSHLIVDMVSKLKNMGFVIELDDFGSGYSSLNTLSQMVLDVLKLDINFVQAETAKPINESILKFVLRLAHWRNLSVVAEGVETYEQLQILKDVGCDYAQGFYFARPMPAEEFEKLLLQEMEREDSDDIRKNLDWSRCLLVADDEEYYRNMVREAYENTYHVLEAEDAPTAIRYLQEHRTEMAVVIVDLSLSNNAGFEILEYLNSKKDILRIPVLATGVHDDMLEMNAYKNGADDFAAKPFQSYSLKKRIRRLFGISMNHEKERQLQEAAFRDYLTGMLNRRGLHVELNNISSEDLPVAVYFFDLDNLKEVNDSCGHEAGDQMIQLFAKLLRASVRSADIMARYGGDEFILIQKKIPSGSYALKKGAEICRKYRKEIIGNDIQAACSAGVAVCKENERYIMECFKKADRALYYAKANYKGGCCLWDKTMQE